MPLAQLELIGRNGAPAARERIAVVRAEEDVKLLVASLRCRKWVVKSELMRELGWSERRIQDAKEQSNWAVISSSQRGYCLGSEATLEEWQQSLREMRGRGRTIIGNYIKGLRAFHQFSPQKVAA